MMKMKIKFFTKSQLKNNNYVSFDEMIKLLRSIVKDNEFVLMWRNYNDCKELKYFSLSNEFDDLDKKAMYKFAYVG